MSNDVTILSLEEIKKSSLNERCEAGFASQETEAILNMACDWHYLHEQLAEDLVQMEHMRDKIATLRSALLSARPTVFRAAHQSSASPWLKETRQEILKKVDEALR